MRLHKQTAEVGGERLYDEGGLRDHGLELTLSLTQGSAPQKEAWR